MRRGDADLAARRIIASDPPDGWTVTTMELYELGEFPATAGEAASTDEYREWTLAALAYRERVRGLLMQAPPHGLGRLLKTNRGEQTLTLLSPLETVEYARSSFFHEALRQARSAMFRVKNAAVEGPEERARQTEAAMQIGAARIGIERAAQADERRRARLRDIEEAAEKLPPKGANPFNKPLQGE